MDNRRERLQEKVTYSVAVSRICTQKRKPEMTLDMPRTADSSSDQNNQATATIENKTFADATGHPIFTASTAGGSEAPIGAGKRHAAGHISLSQLTWPRICANKAQEQARKADVAVCLTYIAVESGPERTLRRPVLHTCF